MPRRQHPERIAAPEGEVRDYLATRGETRGDPVRVGVPAQQRNLEEQHAGRPDRRGPPEPRQDPLADHRLHEKQQKRAEERRRRIDQQDTSLGVPKDHERLW